MTFLDTWWQENPKHAFITLHKNNVRSNKNELTLICLIISHLIYYKNSYLTIISHKQCNKELKIIINDLVA